MKKIILASKSNDRTEIFKRARIPFETFITNINEEKHKAQFSDPVELVKEIAKQKALFAKNKLLEESSNPIIIAADTIVEFNGEIIGKAQNNSEAFKILKKLMGKVHKLITGIAITDIKNPKMILDSDITIVEFLELSDDEILEYIKTDEWKGRAGAYSMNDRASLFINKINGSSSNVIGLPMQKLYKILKKEFDINLFRPE